MSHVFVVSANILRLKADAWMLPTDAWCNLLPHWTYHDSTLERRAKSAAPSSFGGAGRLAFALPPEDKSPLPIAVAVPSDNVWSLKSVEARVNAFVDVALAALGDRPSPRPHLLAMPFLGSKGGAARDLSGQVADLLEAARRAAREGGVDIAVVFYQNDAAFTLAQAHRRMQPAEWWSTFDYELHSEAVRLGELVEKGRVVPFLGAGVSVSAGGPTWNQLLSQLAENLPLEPEAKEGLEQLNPLDRASLMESLYEEQGAARNFRDAVAEAVDLPRYGLAPALLASVPSEGAITLNYDRLFEMACEDSGARRFVIPGDDKHSDRWLLKLHGDAKDPRTIVLTRDDYLGFDANRDALSALVKAHLITHHLLFVGFGLGDDHFYEIVHDVRRAIPAASAGSNMGTALSLRKDPLQERAWRNKLTVLPMTDSTDEGNWEEAAAGRQLEIFLDATIAYGTQRHRYLLAEKFGEGLSDDDRELREDLLSVIQKHDASNQGSIWATVRESLEGFGLDSGTGGTGNRTGWVS